MSDTCIYVPFGIAYTPWLAHSLSKPPQPFPILLLLDLITGEEPVTQDDSPLAFPSPQRPQRSSWTRQDFGCLNLPFKPAGFSPAHKALVRKCCADGLRQHPSQGNASAGHRTGYHLHQKACCYTRITGLLSHPAHTHLPHSANSGTRSPARSHKVSLSMIVSDMCMDNENRQSSDGKD